MRILCNQCYCRDSANTYSKAEHFAKTVFSAEELKCNQAKWEKAVPERNWPKVDWRFFARYDGMLRTSMLCLAVLPRNVLIANPGGFDRVANLGGDRSGLALEMSLGLLGLLGLLAGDLGVVATWRSWSRKGLAGDVVSVGVNCSPSDFLGALSDSEESEGGESLRDLSSSLDSFVTSMTCLEWVRQVTNVAFVVWLHSGAQVCWRVRCHRRTGIIQIDNIGDKTLIAQTVSHRSAQSLTQTDVRPLHCSTGSLNATNAGSARSAHQLWLWFWLWLFLTLWPHIPSAVIPFALALRLYSWWHCIGLVLVVALHCATHRPTSAHSIHSTHSATTTQSHKNIPDQTVHDWCPTGGHTVLQDSKISLLLGKAWPSILSARLH